MVNAIKITMPSDLGLRCKYIADQRAIQARMRQRRGHNGAPGLGQAIVLDELGAGCEGISWYWLDYLPKWNDLAEDIRGLPDLEYKDYCIDVKGVAQKWHSLIVQIDDPSDWLYLLVARDGVEYEIQGWLPGSIAKSHPIKELKEGRPAHVIGGGDKANLLPPSMLSDLLNQGPWI